MRYRIVLFSFIFLLASSLYGQVELWTHANSTPPWAKGKLNEFKFMIEARNTIFESYSDYVAGGSPPNPKLVLYYKNRQGKFMPPTSTSLHELPLKMSGKIVANIKVDFLRDVTDFQTELKYSPFDFTIAYSITSKIGMVKDELPFMDMLLMLGFSPLEALDFCCMYFLYAILLTDHTNNPAFQMMVDNSSYFEYLETLFSAFYNSQTSSKVIQRLRTLYP